MTNECECCLKEKAMYNTAGFHLCKACNLLATRGDMQLVKETIRQRHRWAMEKQLEAMKNKGERE